MKLPRGVSGDRVVRVLARLGYEVLRQKRSDVRLRHPGPPVHLITVRNHDSLKTGTLHGIFAEVASMRGITIEAPAEFFDVRLNPSILAST